MIKGKRKLCETPLGDFIVENVSEQPFYTRYNEFVNVFTRHGIDDFEQLFAEPSHDVATQKIEWYIPEQEGGWKGEWPICYANIPDEGEKNRYKKIIDDIRKRLREVQSKITESLDKKYFSCALQNIDSADEFVYCHNDKIIFAVWGMRLRPGRELKTVITDVVTEHRIHHIKFVIEGQGAFESDYDEGLTTKHVELSRRHNYVLQSTDIPKVKAASRHDFVRWLPDNPQGHLVIDDIVFTAVCEHCGRYLITFNSGPNGHIEGNSSMEMSKGSRLLSALIPIPKADNGYVFAGWEPLLDSDVLVDSDRQYTAVFREKDVAPCPDPEPEDEAETYHNVLFDAGDEGSLPDGKNSISVRDGDTIDPDLVPQVTAHEGKTFSGWDKPLDMPITSDTTFVATYEETPQALPWYRRLWQWVAGKGCLRLLLWLLGVLLLSLAAILLLRGCGNEVGAVPVADTDSVISQPGTPDIVANRLFLFLENENDDVEGLETAFKKVYPGDQYTVLGRDNEVKMLIVQIPESEREEIKQTINSRIPGFRFFVFDEEIYEINASANSFIHDSVVDAGWHLDAIHLRQGWQTTKGLADVKVAIIDDGIDMSHRMFKGRISEAYNVFTQNDNLSVGEGHGTFTAALAVGGDDLNSDGASGVAPHCSIMPVQVFNNGKCPLSALVAGIMYAVHHDADVINVSVGPDFKGLNSRSVADQRVIAETQFKNVEMLWNRVTSIAARKNSIIVFAAGNDDIISSIPPANRNKTSLVVTSVDKRLYPTDFTNYGPCSDISAPGINIYSAYPTDAFISGNGTSASAPIVAGTVALMKSIKKDLTVEQAANVLYNTGADVYGYIPPMVLVDRALEAVLNGDVNTRNDRDYRPVPDADLPTLDSGGGVIVITPVEAGADSDSAATESADSVGAGSQSNGSEATNETFPVSSADGNDVDVNKIKDLIKQHEAEIERLKKLLPPGQN